MLASSAKCHSKRTPSFWFKVTIAISLLIGIGLSLSQANKVLFQFLNHHLVDCLGESFWAVLTNLGDGFFLFPFGMLLMWRCPQRQLAILIGILLLALVTGLTKKWVGLPRPAAVIELAELTIIGPMLKSNSMPSGHSGTAFLMAGFSWLYLKRHWSIPVMIVMSLCALSRVAVGAHWPGDIMSGAFIGLSCSALGHRLSQSLNVSRFSRVLFLILGVSTFLVLLTYDNGFQYLLSVCFMQLLLVLLTGAMIMIEVLDSLSVS